MAYSPVPDPTVAVTRIGGVLATVTETTEQVYGERQLRTLRELGAHAVAAKTAELACTTAAATLRLNRMGCAVCPVLSSRPGRHARTPGCERRLRRGGCRPPEDEDRATRLWPLRDAAHERRVCIVEDLTPLGDLLPLSPHSERPRSAIVLPLASPDQPHAYGLLVCGVSPHRVLDDGYQTFFELVALQVATTIRNARAFDSGAQTRRGARGARSREDRLLLQREP